MKHIIYSVALLMAALLAGGCSEDETPGFGSIYGIVSDADTSQPIYGASVTLSPGNLSTTTGHDGHFEFTDLEPGQYKVAVIASGYLTDSRQITVSAGNRATGDIQLRPKDASSVIELSSTALNFGSNYNELTLTLRNKGNAGKIDWFVSGINVSWLTVSPSQGSTAMAQSSDIKVLVNRELVNSDQSTYFIIEWPGGSQSVTVTVDKENSGGNPGGGDSDKDEDYSPATVITCDARVEAKIVSCKRTGSSVTFTYTLTNTGLGNVNDWRIYPPVYGSVINGGYLSVITDDEGNEYKYPTMTFRGESNPNHILTTSFPENVVCKGTVRLTGVPASAKKINVMLGVFAYPDSQYLLEDKRVFFHNVPVY